MPSILKQEEKSHKSCLQYIQGIHLILVIEVVLNLAVFSRFICNKGDSKLKWQLIIISYSVTLKFSFLEREMENEVDGDK